MGQRNYKKATILKTRLKNSTISVKYFTVALPDSGTRV